MAQSYPMLGGEGPHSYARNSSYQKALLECTMTMTKEVISANLDLPNSHFDCNIFKIADFGCSVGPNTFYVVEKIVEAVRLKYRQENYTNKDGQLEFQVFFNDQSSNDFNTLFRTLPPTYAREYLAVGVPGSFHSRVLPRNSLHIGYTSGTLHWLSRVPGGVCDPNSPAWNKNYIQCNGLVEEVTEVYKAQFKKDMKAFLEARAEELIPGGLMIMSVMCLPNGVKMARTWKGIVIDMIGDCLNDMTKSGVTSAEKVESFNVPIHIPHISTLKEVIEKDECFKIEMMEEVKHPMEDMPIRNDFITSLFRSAFHNTIEGCFGDGANDELFDRFAKKLAHNPIDFQACEKDTFCLVMLKRIVS